MAKEIARKQAAEDAARRLRGIDWPTRCGALGLPSPRDNRIELRILDRECALSLEDLGLAERSTGRAAPEDLRILLLHYLANDVPVVPSGRMVSFRDFPGGRFYGGPFRARSVAPLIKAVGNDLEALRAALAALEWEEVEGGDLGARIRAFGNVIVFLVYRTGDEEFAPTADVLFDASAQRVLAAEDAAVLAQYCCIGLLGRVRGHK